MKQPPPQTPPQAVSLGQAFRYWLKLGFMSFGGPAGQIAIMHQDLVEKKRWISERRFLHALNYCMVLPGPEAQQLATYIGWLMHRTKGGVIAGLMFILPSLFLLILLSWIYMRFGQVPEVAAVLYGIKPAVTAIVLFAAYRIGSRALKNGVMWTIAALAFFAIFVLQAPFPLIVLFAGLLGAIGGRLAPQKFVVGGGHDAIKHSYGPALIDDDTPIPEHARFRWPQLLKIAASGCVIVGWHDRVFVRAIRVEWGVDTNGLVLYQGGAADVWRRLCGPALCLSGRGRTLPLVERHTNDRWLSAG